MRRECVTKKFKLKKRLRGNDAERAWILLQLRDYVNIAGVLEARRTSIILNGVILRACTGWDQEAHANQNNGGDDPAPSTPPPFPVNISLRGYTNRHFSKPFLEAALYGRETTGRGKKFIKDETLKEIHVMADYLELRTSKRSKRQAGDRDVIEFETYSLLAAARRTWCFGKVHGIFQRMLKNIIASCRRALILDGITTVTKGLAKHIRMRICGVTQYTVRNDDGTVEVKAITPPTPTVARHLAKPWARELIAQHRAILSRCLVVDDENDNSLQTVGTFATFVEFLSGGDGWHSIRYLHFLNNQRYAWINSEINLPGEGRRVLTDAFDFADDALDARRMPGQAQNDVEDEIEDDDDDPFINDNVEEVDDENEDEEALVGEGNDDDDEVFEDGEIVRPHWRGRSWYPGRFRLVPLPHLFARHIQLSNHACKQIFGGRTLDDIFVRPRHPSGDKLGDSILTDGVSLCVVYKIRPVSTRQAARSKAITSSATNLSRIRNAYGDFDIDFGSTHSLGAFFTHLRVRCIGFDPGLISILSGREPLADGSVRKWDLTFKEWENKTCALQRRRKAEHWMQESGLKENALYKAACALTSKTPIYNEFIAWAVADIKVTPVILIEKLKPRWANARFRSWQLRLKVLDDFWARVRAGDIKDKTAGIVPIIAYGDASFSSSMRGRRSGPTSAAYKSCLRVLGAENVFLTDEHLTTKTCACCGAPLQEISHNGLSACEHDRAEKRKASDAERVRLTGGLPIPRRTLKHWRVVHGLRRCINAGDIDNNPCARAGQLVSRDGNAALNILRRFMSDVCGLDTPAHLRTGLPKIIKPRNLKLRRTKR